MAKLMAHIKQDISTTTDKMKNFHTLKNQELKVK